MPTGSKYNNPQWPSMPTGSEYKKPQWPRMPTGSKYIQETTMALYAHRQ